MEEKLKTDLEKKYYTNKFRSIAIKDWDLEGTKRYGINRKKWRFRCPNCGDVVTVECMKTKTCFIPLQDCPCGWKGNGGNPITVIVSINNHHNIFDFADDPLCDINR